MSETYDGTILVVEDEAELRFILSAHLRASGFEVIEAEDGEPAVELARRHIPDLILMDIGLPGQDGITATRRIKEDPATADIPVIMLSARSGSADVIRGLEAGAQEYLYKPFDVAGLLARVRTVYRLAKAHKDLNRLNTRLEAEVDVKTQRLQDLYEYMRDLNQAETRNQILDLLVERVQLTTSAGRVSVFLAEGQGDELTCVRAVGIDPPIEGKSVSKIPGGIIGQVVASGKTLAAKTYASNAFDERGYRSDSFVSTPLRSPRRDSTDGVHGVLNVTDKTNGSAFSEDEIDCIRSMSDAAAIALNNTERRTRLQSSVSILLRTVGHLAEYRDEETTLHLERVANMARIIAEELQRDGPYAIAIRTVFIDSLVQAAPMHDIGKVGIPDDILTKPGKLTDEEFQIMKTHADIGRRVLSRALDPAHPVPLLQMCIDIAHCHHERYDGTGYPRRIAGNDIPLAARIIALVDAYDAITSRRRYKDAKSHQQAVEIIQSESGRHFDPVIVDAFMRCEDRFNGVRARYDEPGIAVPIAAVG